MRSDKYRVEIDGNKFQTLCELAKYFARSEEWVKVRLAILSKGGRRSFTSKEFNDLNMSSHNEFNVNANVVYFEGYGKTTMHRIATDPELCADMGKTSCYFWKRWKRRGGPEKVNRDFFKEGNTVKTAKGKVVAVNDGWGNLSHTKNTGAAVDPDAEMWSVRNRKFSKQYYQ